MNPCKIDIEKTSKDGVSLTIGIVSEVSLAKLASSLIVVTNGKWLSRDTKWYPMIKYECVVDDTNVTKAYIL